jgi:hypothetical protein
MIERTRSGKVGWRANDLTVIRGWVTFRMAYSQEGLLKLR